VRATAILSPVAVLTDWRPDADQGLLNGSRRVVRTLERMVTPARMLGVFVVLLFVGITSHEMWRDEIQAWALARDSGSIGALVDNAAYEGHPLLWYLLLWVLSRFTRSPVAMQVLQMATAIGAAALVAWKAPFPRLARAALLLGFFPLYEYGVKARPYGLTLLLVVAACVLAGRPRRPLLAVAAVLALLTQTTAYGLLVAAALAVAVAVDELVGRIWTDRRRLVTAAAAAAMVAGAAVLSLVQVVPPADAPFGAGLATPEQARGDSRSAVAVVAAAVVHVHEGLPGLREGHLDTLGVVVGTVLLLAVAVGLVRRPAALALWVTGAGAILALTALRFHGNMRHHGHVAVLLLAACWLHGACRGWPPALVAPLRGRWPSRVVAGVAAVAPVALAGVLAVQLAAGAAALAQDVRQPYSGVPPAAAVLRDAGLADAPMVGEPDFVALAVTALLDHEAYVPARGEAATFLRWDPERGGTSDEEVVAVARRIAGAEDEAVVIISGRRLDLAALGHPPDLEGLAHLDDNISTEDVHLYVLTP
jgi:hypothetical protein